jgi:hypothetical protein
MLRQRNLASDASRASVGKPKRRAEIRGNSRSCRMSPTEPELRNYVAAADECEPWLLRSL